MNTFYFGLALGLSLFGFGECADVNTVLPPGRITWTNRPKTNWKCPAGRNYVKVFSPQKIITAMNHGVPLWGAQKFETWKNNQTFPVSISEHPINGWNGIKGWPAKTERDQWPHELCHRKWWVGGYPITLEGTQPENPGRSDHPQRYRALISGGYMTKDAEEETYSYFAFCGVAQLIDPSKEDSYSMCWTAGSDDDVTVGAGEQAVIV